MAAILKEPCLLTQPSTGKELTLIIDGDEFGADFSTQEGYTVLFNDQMEMWVYADKASTGSLVPTIYPACEPAPAHLVRGLSDDPVKRAQIDKLRADRIEDRYFRQRDKGMVGAVPRVVGTNNGLLPGRIVHGNVRGLVVIVEFKDIKAFPDAVTLVNGMMNGTQPHSNNSTTVEAYFRTISNGRFNFVNHVHPTIVSLPNNKSFYMRNSIVPLVLDAIKDEVTFADYDSLDEGYVDAVSFLYAGDTAYGDQRIGNTELWPHNSTHMITKHENNRLYQTYFYMLTSLGINANSLTIGTSCHELAHLTLRWPDLYDYGDRDGRDRDIGAGKSKGIGPYCLMGSGNHVGNGRNPVPACGYLRQLSGFTDATVLLNGVSQTHEIRADDYSSIYRYNVAPNEYFIIENHTSVGLRSGMGANSGLAVMHCDTEGSNEWQINTPRHHYQTYLLQADGLEELERNRRAGVGDLFENVPGIALSYDTDPTTRAWDGTDSGLVISEISAPGPTMTFASGLDAADTPNKLPQL